mmetsp:Transcript_3555/g.10785  ORF Transcript_3555/g.10785 Transcript_3555/m.10785 type:complete len:210 (-) Transcript_3555:963-1592(-)
MIHSMMGSRCMFLRMSARAVRGLGPVRGLVPVAPLPGGLELEFREERNFLGVKPFPASVAGSAGAALAALSSWMAERKAGFCGLAVGALPFWMAARKAGTGLAGAFAEAPRVWMAERKAGLPGAGLGGVAAALAGGVRRAGLAAGDCCFGDCCFFEGDACEASETVETKAHAPPLNGSSASSRSSETTAGPFETLTGPFRKSAQSPAAP